MEEIKKINMKIFIIFGFFITVTYSQDLTNILGAKCPRRGSDVVKCIKEKVEKLKPFLKKGITEINVPRFEPFKIQELDLDADVPGMTMKGAATNVVAYGGTNFQIKNLKADIDKAFMDIELYFPKLTVTADYDAFGSKIFNIETSGTGQFRAELKGVHAHVISKGHVVKKNGLDYQKIDDLTTTIKIDDGILNVEPDKQTFATKTVAGFIRSNSKMILNSLHEVIDKAAAPIVKRYVSRTLNVMPIEYLFE